MTDHRQDRRRITAHRLFAVGIVLKLLDGVLELCGAVLIMIVDPQHMNHIARFLTTHDLSEDSDDFIADHVFTFMHHLAGRDRVFAVIYLLLHGLTKIVLVIELLRRRLWAYPAMLVVLGLFLAYQAYRIYLGHSTGMIALSILDAIVLWLVWHEWRSVRARVHARA